MLQFLIGESGTGKSAYVGRKVIESARAGKRVCVVVPEYASFETEQRYYREILRGLPPETTRQVEIRTFPGLADAIFRQCGGLTHRALEDRTRIIVLKRALKEVRGELTVLKRQAAHDDFLPMILETITECKTADLRPDGLLKLSGSRGPSPLWDKLRDIARIYGAYQALMETAFHDPRDEMSLAAELADRKKFFRGRVVFLDEFQSFHLSQMKLVDVMMADAEILMISLSADSADPSENLFLRQKQFLRRFRRRAGELGVPTGMTVHLDVPRRFRSEELVLLQRAMLDREVSLPERPFSDIRLLRPQNVYEEMDCVAAEIARLVREENYRYRDIAILSRSFERYRSARHALERYGIPFFLAERDPVDTHLLPRFLIQALEAVTASFPTATMLELARSPGSGLTPEEAGELENYVFVWNVRGKDWASPFTRNPDGMTDAERDPRADRAAGIEAARKRLVVPLLTLGERIRRATGPDFARAFFAYVEETEVLARITEGTSVRERAAADREWNAVVDVLDSLSELLPETVCEGRELAGLFRLSLSQIDLADVPNTKDRVLFAEASHAKLFDPRAVFVVGVNEGLFPAEWQGSGLLSPRERQRLRQEGVDLLCPGIENSLWERFLLYQALSSAREKIYVSSPVSGFREEDALAPSAWLTAVMEKLGIRPAVPADLRLSDFVVNIDSAKSVWARHFQEKTPFIGALTALLEKEGASSFMNSVFSSAEDRPAPDMDPGILGGLLGPSIRLSPTGIERFYRCPYSYLCEKILRLRPRRRVEYSYFESGSAIHHVFERFLSVYGSRGLRGLSDAELETGTEEYLREYVARMIPDEDAVPARFHYQFRRLKLMLKLILRHMGEELAQSGFVTVGTEVPVGPGKTVDSPKLKSPGGRPVELVGRVDRVDRFRSDAGDYVRVVDYKSGTRDFVPEEVRHGLNMQMLLYLYAVCDDSARPFGDVSPAGVLYVPTKLDAVDTEPGAGPESADGKIDRALRMQGMLLRKDEVLKAMEPRLEGRYIPVSLSADGGIRNGPQTGTEEDFRKLRGLVYGNLLEMARMLETGRVSPFPARSAGKLPCEYCDYRALCNHDGQNGPVRDVGKPKGGEAK